MAHGVDLERLFRDSRTGVRDHREVHGEVLDNEDFHPVKCFWLEGVSRMPAGPGTRKALIYAIRAFASGVSDGT